MFIAFWTTQFLKETIKIGPNSPMVRLIVIIFCPTNLLANKM